MRTELAVLSVVSGITTGDVFLNPDVMDDGPAVEFSPLTEAEDMLLSCSVFFVRLLGFVIAMYDVTFCVLSFLLGIYSASSSSAFFLFASLDSMEAFDLLGESSEQDVLVYG